MTRVLVLLVIGIGLALTSVSASAQDDDPEATIAALETRVADLEQQLGLTPTPTATSRGQAATAQNTVVGNAHLPAGEPGALSLIAVGPYAHHDLPVVVRNNTPDTLEFVTVDATARSADGQLLSSGSSLALDPPHVVPGGVAFGDVSFGGVELPADTSFAFKVQGQPPRDPSEAFQLEYHVTEISRIDGRFVGQVVNNQDHTLSLSGLSLMCFDERGTPVRSYFGSINPDRVDPGQSATFQVLLDEGESCPRFLAEADGSKFP